MKNVSNNELSENISLSVLRGENYEYNNCVLFFIPFQNTTILLSVKNYHCKWNKNTSELSYEKSS